MLCLCEVRESGTDLGLKESEFTFAVVATGQLAGLRHRAVINAATRDAVTISNPARYPTPREAKLSTDTRIGRSTFFLRHRPALVPALISMSQRHTIGSRHDAE